ncbi:hypothetical protein F3J23_15255 [Chryseobacterium sp. Tr-659]|uniref:hypothetical protein n=1 Tax=Chryseobacterium sp. Tr-659 TaxID=2608340 RepID=UPI00141DBD2C|nr:hypothetical protein [Chryseobacterium sp. Tr-659]NIF06804.1 hypothetical protein [Chryseobacterium sp. Tr-659]
MASIFLDMLRINNEGGVIMLKPFNTRLYKGMRFDQHKQTDFYKENTGCTGYKSRILLVYYFN